MEWEWKSWILSLHCDVQIAILVRIKLEEKMGLCDKRILLSCVFWTEMLSWFQFPTDPFSAKLLSLVLTCHVRSVFSLFWQCVTLFSACVASCTVYCSYARGFYFSWIIRHLCGLESISFKLGYRLIAGCYCSPAFQTFPYGPECFWELEGREWEMESLADSLNRIKEKHNWPILRAGLVTFLQCNFLYFQCFHAGAFPIFL